MVQLYKFLLQKEKEENDEEESQFEGELTDKQQKI